MAKLNGSSALIYVPNALIYLSVPNPYALIYVSVPNQLNGFYMRALLPFRLVN